MGKGANQRRKERRARERAEEAEAAALYEAEYAGKPVGSFRKKKKKAPPVPPKPAHLSPSGAKRPLPQTPDEKEYKKRLRGYMLAAKRKGMPLDEYLVYRENNPAIMKREHIKRASRGVRKDRYAKWTPSEFIEQGKYLKVPWEKMKKAGNPHATDEKKKEWIAGRRGGKKKLVSLEKYQSWSPQEFIAKGKKIPWKKMAAAGNPYAGDKKQYQKAKRMDAKRIAKLKK